MRFDRHIRQRTVTVMTAQVPIELDDSGPLKRILSDAKWAEPTPFSVRVLNVYEEPPKSGGLTYD